jgi:hypothetical protein
LLDIDNIQVALRKSIQLHVGHIHLSTAKYEFYMNISIWVAQGWPKIRWATLECILICNLARCWPRASGPVKKYTTSSQPYTLKNRKIWILTEYFNLTSPRLAQNSIFLCNLTRCRPCAIGPEKKYTTSSQPYIMKYRKIRI